MPGWPELLWVLAVLPLAAYLHGLLGLGFVTVAMPLLVMVLDLRLTMVLSVPAAWILAFQLTFLGGNIRQSIGRFWYLPIFMAAGAVSGAWVFQHARQEWLLLVIAGAIVLFLSLDFLKKAHVHVPASWAHPAAMLFGFLAGNTETAVNMGAPFLLIFCLLSGFSPTAVVQLINLCFFTGKTIHFITLSVGGAQVAPVTPIEWLPGFLIAPLCIWLCYQGARRRAKTDVETYRGWLKVFLKLMVVVLLGKVVLLT
ncbi:sulfite exporter TauE/SafE family protein [beta proteobacterium MWH-UniP1]